MKEINKVKAKLKRWNWLNKHLGTVVLSAYIPLILGNMFFYFINPPLAIAFLGLAFVTITTGGFVKICYADEENYKILYEKQIAAMETVTEEKLEVLEKSIENYKQNPTMVKDKKTTKSLVKELIKIHKSAEKR